MKKIICLLFTLVMSVSIVTAPAASTAASPQGSVSGIGSGTFSRGSTLAGINLTSFEVATGVLTESDGSAEGVFHADLSGRTVLGAVRLLTLEGNVVRGTTSMGSSSFSGLGSLDMGNGLPALSGVPFKVETNGNNMMLTIQSTVLPAAAFKAGGLDSE